MAAAEAVGWEHGECVVWMPLDLIVRLSHAGRRTWEQVAVLDSRAQPMERTIIMFLDLRGLTHFPQWVQLDRELSTPEPIQT